MERLGELIPKPYLGKEQREAFLSRADLAAKCHSSVDAAGRDTMSVTALYPVPDAYASLTGKILRKHPVKVVPEKGAIPVEKLINLSPSRLIYRALLGLVMAVVAMVVGYLVGPALQRQLAHSSHSSAPSLLTGVEAAAASAQNATYRTALMRSVPDLLKLADQGTADAQWQLAIRYHNGEGVPQDDTQAMKWFERAAEQGHVDAQSHLGAYYWAGRGVREDLSKAYFWSSIAMAQGDEISKARLEGLASQMTRDQVSTARQQAEVWIHDHNFARTAKN